MEIISKPSKRVFMDLTEIRRLCTGRRAQNIQPLGLGEIIVVRTADPENEWLEAREAVQMKLSGEVVCRAQ
jgi:ribosomal protein S8